MQFPAAVLALALAGPAVGADSSIIRSVEIAGATRSMKLETRAGSAVDPGCLTRDVRRLWATGHFADIRVERIDGPGGAHIIFRVVEKPQLVLDQVRYRPGSHRSPLRFEKGSPMDRRTAQQVAAVLRTQLRQDGHPDPVVSASLVPTGPRKVDLQLYIDPGERVRIRETRFLGRLGLAERDLKDALRATKVRTIIPGIWKRRRPLSDEALGADIARVRSLLFSRGYFDANVRLDHVDYRDQQAVVTLAVNSGDRYGVRRLEMVDLDKAEQFSPGLPRPFQGRDLCRCLFDLRRRAQEEGRMDFDVVLRAADSEAPPALAAPFAAVDRASPARQWVDLSVRIQTGPPYTVGRIEFQGARSFSDSTVRRAFVLDEAALFDWDRLRRSLVRVNQLGLFEPLTSEQVKVVRNPAERTADVFVWLKQAPRGRWFLSGPVGPASVGGPLQATIMSRLPAWGRGLLEASTYYLTFSVSAFANPILRFLQVTPQRNWLPILALERPYLPGQWWQSGFVLSPQLDWESMAAGYGVSQVRHAIRWVARADAPAKPEILVTVRRLAPGAEPVDAGVLLCDPPGSHWSKLRTAGLWALDLLLPPRPF